MRILYCHNIYQQPGGEDVCFEDEAKLLEAHGHTVHRYVRDNDDIDKMSRTQVVRQTFWSSRTYRELSDLMKHGAFDVMHCMNTFPLISPSAYYAARKHGVAVVQTIANFRLVCPGAYLMRDHRVCLDCLDKIVPWPAIQHSCYRGSRAGSAVLASMLVAHRVLGTWKSHVHRYCALSQTGREAFVRGGLPADRISVKPNFIDPVPEPGEGQGGYILFVGRLSPEKGLQSLLEAWTQMSDRPPLKIVGDGPMRAWVEETARTMDEVEYLGFKKLDEVVQIMGNAAALIIPSLWYEGFPRTLLESIAKGTPIIASNLGIMGEITRPGINGWLFEPGDVASIRDTVQKFWHSPESWPALRVASRQNFLDHYTAEINYRQLVGIYEEAIEERRRAGA